MFVWLSDDPDDDLGEYFQEILDHLKTPLLHSVEAFLLPDTHDRIRCFREALRSGPGLMVKRNRAKEPDFWDVSYLLLDFCNYRSNSFTHNVHAIFSR